MSLLAYSLITIIQKLSWIIYILIMIRAMLKPFKDFLDKYINLPIDFSPLLFLLCLQAVERILIRLIIVIF